MTYNPKGQIINKYEIKVDPIDGLLYLYLDGERQGIGIDVGQEGYDVSTVAEFYQTEVLNALKSVNAMGDDWTHYLAVADQHYTTNYDLSPTMLKVMYDSGLFDKVFFLGDQWDSAQAKMDAWLTAHEDLLPHALPVMGNHDPSATTVEGVTALYEWAKTNLYDQLDDVNIHFGTAPNACFYYYDSPEHIRFIVIDTHYNDFTAGETAFIENAINTVPDGWTFFIVQHEPVIDWASEYDASGKVDKFNAPIYLALKTNFGTAICGHEHWDMSIDRYGYFHQDTFCCDGHENSPVSRSASDASAQAITVISINTAEKRVKFLRIGAVDNLHGNPFTNKQYEIAYGAHEGGKVEGYETITNNTLYPREGSATWFDPIAVDTSNPCYIYHADDTDLNGITNYRFSQYDEDGNYIGRTDVPTLVDAKTYRVNFSDNNTKYILKSAKLGDDIEVGELT